MQQSVTLRSPPCLLPKVKTQSFNERMYSQVTQAGQEECLLRRLRYADRLPRPLFLSSLRVGFPRLAFRVVYASPLLGVEQLVVCPASDLLKDMY